MSFETLNIEIGDWSELAMDKDGRELQVWADIEASIKTEGAYYGSPAIELSNIALENKDSDSLASELTSSELPLWFSQAEILKIYKSASNYAEERFLSQEETI